MFFIDFLKFSIIILLLEHKISIRKFSFNRFASRKATVSFILFHFYIQLYVLQLNYLIATMLTLFLSHSLSTTKYRIIEHDKRMWVFIYILCCAIVKYKANVQLIHVCYNRCNPNRSTLLIRLDFETNGVFIVTIFRFRTQISTFIHVWNHLKLQYL